MDKNEELKSLLDFALLSCCEAGGIAMQYFRSDMEISNKSATADFFDPVTKADKEIENFLRDRIKARFPEHSIVGEEGGTSTGESAYTWVIDPIDGTRGFAIGSPMWGILLGLIDGDTCVAGVMHQPLLKESYIGSSEGAFILSGEQKKRLSSSSKKNISDSVMCCTHHLMFDNDQDMNVFHQLVDACQFSRFGTDCHGYALLAMGSVDFILESNLANYDIVPLIPLVEASGGIVTDWNGQPAHQGGHVLASANRELHQKLLDFIKQH